MTSMRRVKLELFLTVCLCMLTFVESRESASSQLRADLRRLSTETDDSSIVDIYTDEDEDDRDIDEDAYDDDDDDEDEDDEDDANGDADDNEEEEDDAAEESQKDIVDDEDGDDEDNDEDEEDDEYDDKAVDDSEEEEEARFNLLDLSSPTTIRIVGGTEVPLEKSEYSFVASLQRGSTNFPFCGGSLISKRFVMTAGHCVKTKAPDRVEIGNFDLSKSKTGVVRTVQEVIRHPFYSGVTNDIALLYLSEDVTDIEPVMISPQLFEAPQEADSQMLTVIGWGYTSEGSGVVQDRLRQVDVPIVSQTRCAESYAGIDDTKICAGYDYDGLDSCSGDSGGPLFYTDSDTGGITQVGIVSYGRGCARAGYYGVYARPSAFIDWISDTLASYNEELVSEHGTEAPTNSPTSAPTVSDDPGEQAEYDYCIEFASRRRCKSSVRDGRCFWNGKSTIESMPRASCLPVFLLTTQAPTPAPSTTTIYTPESRAEMQSEMNFCHTSKAQLCSTGERVSRCFWNSRRDGYFGVPYFRNKCLPNILQEIFP